MATAKKWHGYGNPLRDVQNLQPERVDQGVDYSGTGPVYALGNGTVVATTNQGWPGGGFIVVRLSDGPLAGRYVYTAENISPAVQVGQQVTPATVIGQMNGGIETGFAAPPPNLGNSLAKQLGQGFPNGPGGAYDNRPTAVGYAYSRILAALGAKPGVITTSATGTLPGWLKYALPIIAGPLAPFLPGGGGGITNPLSGITETGHWLGVLVTNLTDVHMWISLGWLQLGVLLILIGAFLWFQGTRTGQQLKGAAVDAALVAAK